MPVLASVPQVPGSKRPGTAALSTRAPAASVAWWRTCRPIVAAACEVSVSLMRTLRGRAGGKKQGAGAKGAKKGPAKVAAGDAGKVPPLTGRKLEEVHSGTAEADEGEDEEPVEIEVEDSDAWDGDDDPGPLPGRLLDTEEEDA